MMDVPTLMYNLKEEVTCSVCIHLYTNPKQLPCLHIFCLECLNNLARTSTRYGKVKCPICQSEVSVPETGTMETLPSCFYVKNLLDILAIKECNTSKVTCGNCDKKSEEASYCFHCGGFWCNVCVNGHNILRTNRDHRVVSLKDFQDEDFEDVLKRPAFCQKELHEKEVLKFYCKVCEVPVCQICVIVEHNKHDVGHLEVCARAVKNTIASKLETVKKSSETFLNSIGKLEQTTRVLEHRSQIMIDQIQETARSLIFTIQQQEQELTAMVESETKTLLENNMTSKAKFQGQLKKNKEIMKQAEHLLERSSGAELVRIKTVIDELFEGLQVQEPQDMPPSSDWSSVNMFVKNDEVSKCLQELRIGHLATNDTATKASQCSVEEFQEATEGIETEFEVVTRNSQGEQYYCPGDYIEVCITSPEGAKVAAEIEIVDKNNDCYRISFIPSGAGQQILTVRVNGEKIRDFPPIHIKEHSFIPVNIIGEGIIDGINLENPWGVVVNGSNEIFVTDKRNNRIVVFNEKGEFIRSFGHDLVELPTGICTDDKGRIFVANRANNKILLFDSKGEYVTAFHNGELLKEPRGTSLDARGNLVVCDAGNKCVKFFSPEGEIFKTIGRGRLRMPFDCLCYDDKVFVSDRDADLIKVYKSNGRFLYEFGRFRSGDGNSNHFSGLAVDKTGHLLVCCENTHTVQVFTLEGKYVTKFGGLGKELGQLNWPTTVSVLKSGHVIVCEFGSDSLQIFE